MRGARRKTREHCGKSCEHRRNVPSLLYEFMANNPSITDIVQVLERRVRQELNDRLPRRVGVMAVNHFNQNFRDSGWRDNGLHPWLRVHVHTYLI